MARSSKRRRKASLDGHTGGRIQPSRTSPDKADGNTRIRELEQELQNLRGKNAEQQRSIVTLSSRLSAAEFECGRVRESASKAAEYNDNVFMQRDLRYENSVLKCQLQQITSQRQIIVLGATIEPLGRTIQQEFELIDTNLKDACSSVEISISPNSVETSRETESWTHRVASCSFGQLLSSATDADISDFDIVRALASAGTTELVFESRFPDFLPWESPLLDEYRGHLLAKAGPQMLHELDFLACNSVMSKDDFASHSLQDRANSLSDRFCTALAQVISPHGSTTISADWPYGLQSPAPPESAACPKNPVALVFIEAFVRALQLKTKLVLSRSKYRLVFFSPQERFDPHTMRLDGDGWSAFVPERARRRRSGWPTPRPLAVRDGSSIKLCLFPALYSKPVAELTHDYGVAVDVKRCLVDCDNFVRDDADTGLDGFSLVVKAVVLV